MRGVNHASATQHLQKLRVSQRPPQPARSPAPPQWAELSNELSCHGVALASLDDQGVRAVCWDLLLRLEERIAANARLLEMCETIQQLPRPSEAEGPEEGLAALVAELQQALRNRDGQVERLQAHLAVVRDENARLRSHERDCAGGSRGSSPGDAGTPVAEADATAWVSAQLQQHDTEQAMKQLQQTVCELLQVREAGDIIPALSLVVRGCRKLPQLDAFVGAVSALVLDAPSRAGLHSNRLSEVVPILQRWKAERAEGSVEQLRAFRANVAQTLMLLPQQDGASATLNRSRGVGTMMLDERSMVQAVVRLVRDRTEAIATEMSDRGVYAQAESLMDPSALPTNMVQHFQHLFGNLLRTTCNASGEPHKHHLTPTCSGAGIDTIEGVYPAFQRLWLQTNQTTNSLKVLRSLLYLDESASMQACVAAVEQRLHCRQRS